MRTFKGTVLRHGADMTQAQVANIYAQWTQQREPLCEHPMQEFVRLARSDDGVLLGTYHCRECGEAIIYLDQSPPFSTGNSTPNSVLQIFARRVCLAKSGMVTMLFGQLPRGSMPKQGEDKHNNGRPTPLAKRP